MGRKKIWPKEIKTMKIKTDLDTFDRYKGYLKMKKKTIQEDLEGYVKKTIDDRKK